MSTLALWESVEATDPAFTRPMEGAFAGTAINPTYLYRRATEAFGPVGLGWGYEIVSEDTIEGSHLGYDSEGKDLGFGKEHVLLLRLWYRLNGERGELCHYGQTTYISRRGEQIVADTDHRKKSITDALSKCLSMLGFAADVFMGRYDDSKYVAQRMADKSKRTSQPSHSSQVQQAQQAPATAVGALTQDQPTPAQAQTGQAAGAEQEPSAVASVQLRQPTRRGSPKPNNVEAWVSRVGFLGIDAIKAAETAAHEALDGEALDKVLQAIEERRANLLGATPKAA
jgi:hypothetical protein